MPSFPRKRESIAKSDTTRLNGEQEKSTEAISRIDR